MELNITAVQPAIALTVETRGTKTGRRFDATSRNSILPNATSSMSFSIAASYFQTKQTLKNVFLVEGYYFLDKTRRLLHLSMLSADCGVTVWHFAGHDPVI